jgi:hypothetical protein
MSKTSTLSGAKTLNIPFGYKVKEEDICFCCQQKAEVVGLWGRSY